LKLRTPLSQNRADEPLFLLYLSSALIENSPILARGGSSMIRACLPVTLLLLVTSVAPSATPLPADFKPDPYSVQRHGNAYRYPQAGWIVLHIEGEPYERGFQHGKLLAPEIASYVRCLAALASPKAPSEGWTLTRQTINALFLRRFDKEWLEEMKGIADGASAAGARFDDRPIDVVDIAGLNLLPELDTLGAALEATPTGLEGVRFPKAPARHMPPANPMHCSAFAATGPATADGKIVFGHITMYGLYPSLHFNVWIDVKPAKGRRVLMQSYPGGIQSGLDYYLNDAGLIVCETTIRQTRFNAEGKPVGARIRQALQYAESIDKAVEILKQANNGLYTNEWLLADVKTNEIAMLELGTGKSRLRRSSKNEWFAGTEGFYWGCNNTKDLQVRLETVASVKGQPENVVWRPSNRDQKWLELYRKHKGKIDADFGRLAFTTPPLASYHSLDAKYTTSDMAKDLKTWALFGPPLGKTWQPTEQERHKFDEVRPLVSNPWAVLHAGPPAKEKIDIASIRDLSERVRDAEKDSEKEKTLKLEPVWRGTLLPKSDADIWLAAGFAEYERLVGLEKQIKEAQGEEKKKLQNRLMLEHFAHRSGYLAGTRATRDVPLTETKSDYAQAHWYRIAAGKGVGFLHALRDSLGADAFAEMMDAFGQDHAGKEVTTAEFQEHATKWAAKKEKSEDLSSTFNYWLKRPGMPKLRLDEVNVKEMGPKTFVVEGVIRKDLDVPTLTVPVCVEAGKDETKQERVRLVGPQTPFRIEVTSAPRRVVLDPLAEAPTSSGATYSIITFVREIEQTLIVYGTADERATNREAAEALQRALLERGPNVTVPIKSDQEVTEEALKKNHVIVIGRPDSCAITARFREALPVTFGPRSFIVGRDVYAHAGSALIVAAENPLNARFSLVVIAGLSAESTLHAAPRLARAEQRDCEVLLLPNNARTQSLVLPPRAFVKTLQVHK
jgi:hypothetical protein